MPTDPTPTAADLVRDIFAAHGRHRITDGALMDDVARALATARHDADAGYARGRAEGLREDRRKIAEFLRSFETTSYEITLSDFAEAIETGAFEALAPPPTPEPMPPDDIAEQWEDCTGLPDCPGCRVRHPDAPGTCGGFAADTPPTPESLPSRRALPEQREWVPPGERDGGGS